MHAIGTPVCFVCVFMCAVLLVLCGFRQCVTTVVQCVPSEMFSCAGFLHVFSFLSCGAAIARIRPHVAQSVARICLGLQVCSQPSSGRERVAGDSELV
jgi:hypothetical protein